MDGLVTWDFGYGYFPRALYRRGMEIEFYRGFLRQPQSQPLDVIARISPTLRGQGLKFRSVFGNARIFALAALWVE